MGDSIAGSRVNVSRGTASVGGSVLQSNRNFQNDHFHYESFGCEILPIHL